MADPRASRILEDLRRHAVAVHGAYAGREALAYSMAAQHLRTTLGESWASANLFLAPRGDPYLEVGPQGSDELAAYYQRVVNLGELVLNLASIAGARNRFERLASVSLEPAIAELEGAKLLYLASIPFRFVEESQTRGCDFDVEVTPRDGAAIACEMKCKRIETKCSQDSFVNTIRKARKQLPRDRPCLVFLQIPEAWSSPEEPGWVVTSIENELDSSSRLAGLVLFSHRCFVLPNGQRAYTTARRSFPNWKSSHVWHAHLEVLHKLDRDDLGHDWIDLPDEAEKYSGK